jgi:predicted lipid-binding transport protein (Tim44 family)
LNFGTNSFNSNQSLNISPSNPQANIVPQNNNRQQEGLFGGFGGGNFGGFGGGNQTNAFQV